LYFDSTESRGWGYTEAKFCKSGAHPLPKQKPLAKEQLFNF
jgi:hypothetical protein